MDNQIAYYDNSLHKYVLIDTKTGFSSYQSADDYRQQNQRQTSKQLLRHITTDSQLPEIDSNSSANCWEENKQNINNNNGMNKAIDGRTDEHFLPANRLTQTLANNGLLEGFSLTSDMRINSSIKLDKRLLSDGRLRVIGQMARKLIVCLAVDRNLLLAFDQHAVHERIRYEALLRQVYHNNRDVRTVPVLPPLVVALDSHHLQRDFDFYQKSIKTLIGYELQRHPTNCESRQTNRYSVTRIPKCLSESSDLESIAEIIKDAIIVITDKVNESNDVTAMRLTPKVVERLQTKACKGAIRFGDVLKHHDCIRLMNSLAKCKNCYRCAHGRSSVAPLAYLPKPVPQSDH